MQVMLERLTMTNIATNVYACLVRQQKTQLSEVPRLLAQLQMLDKG
jgi:hypothetical protein